jgi:ubiquinone/menaquinone biosynthesis C-methylase UbiE
VSADKAGRAASFDRAAEVYERARPEYPAEAVEWMLPADAKVVLDLGAGTGKLTRALAARGLDVIAVDPAPNMLAQLSAAIPEAAVSVGTAEDIPLADASVDAIVAGQAWHWVDQERAIPQVARVLRPGGTLGLIWNMRDERVGWVARLTEVMHPAEGEVFARTGTIERGPFGEIESANFEWSAELTRDDLLNLLRSRSYFITADDAEQASIVQGVHDLLDNDPDVGGQQTWTMPYVTRAFRMRLPA